MAADTEADTEADMAAADMEREAMVTEEVPTSRKFT